MGSATYGSLMALAAPLATHSKCFTMLVHCNKGTCRLQLAFVIWKGLLIIFKTVGVTVLSLNTLILHTAGKHEVSIRSFPSNLSQPGYNFCHAVLS